MPLSDHIFEILDDHRMQGHEIEEFEQLCEKLKAFFSLVTDPENQPRRSG